MRIHNFAVAMLLVARISSAIAGPAKADDGEGRVYPIAGITNTTYKLGAKRVEAEVGLSSQFKPARYVVMSLDRTDRGPRAKKFLGLMPGNITSHFYTVLKPDGSVITKEANVAIPGVRDARSLRDKHPDAYWIIVGLQVTTGPLVAAAISLFGGKRL